MLKGYVYFLNFFVISALLSLQVVSCIFQVFQEQIGETLKNNKQYKGDNQKYRANSLHNGSFVGFTAWKQSRQEYDNGDIIVFDGITLNEGNHYDTRSNLFTCPVDGIYFVSVTARGDDIMDRTQVAILAGGQAIYELYNFNGVNSLYTVTQSGLFQCTQAQRVWVQGRGDGAVNAGLPGIPYSSFTVFLMQQKDLMHESFIGVSAYKTSIQEYVSGQTIFYQEALVNEGGSYIPDVSRFNCPVSGIYYTTINTYNEDCPPHTKLGVSLNSLFILHSRDNEENCNSIASNSRIFRCSEGDIITVQGLEVGTAYGDSDLPPISTFTAMLMLEDGTEQDNQHSTFVGFSAFKQSNQTYEVGDAIIFDGVLLNLGDSYQPLFGRFICPANGIYYVALTVKRLDSRNLLIDVEYQTNVLFRLSSSRLENPWNPVSSSALLRCFVGEEISVKAAGPGSILGNGSEALSVFTVMKMFEY